MFGLGSLHGEMLILYSLLSSLTQMMLQRFLHEILYGLGCNIISVSQSCLCKWEHNLSITPGLLVSVQLGLAS